MNFRSLLVVFFAFICSALLSLGLMIEPSFAATAQGSDPTQGTQALPETMEETEKVAKSPPMSMKEVGERSERGLNEVQVDADKDKMYNNHANEPGPAVVKNIEKALDKMKKK